MSEYDLISFTFLVALGDKSERVDHHLRSRSSAAVPSVLRNSTNHLTHRASAAAPHEKAVTDPALGLDDVADLELRAKKRE